MNNSDMEKAENQKIGNFIMRNNSKISKLVSNFYLALLITLLILIINSLLQIIQYNNILEGYTINSQLFSISSKGNFILVLLSILLYPISTIMFLVWFYRVYSNTHLLSPDNVRHSKLMAVFSFILPIFNLFKPYQIAKEIITESNKAVVYDSIENIPPLNKSIIISWWTFHLICNVTISIASKLISFDTLEQYLKSYYVFLILFSVSILTILFTLRMIRQISWVDSLLFEKHTNPTLNNDIEIITE